MDKPIRYTTKNGEIKYRVNYSYYDSYGCTQRSSKGGFKTSKEAKVFAREKSEEYDNQIPRVADKLTLDNFLDLWLDNVKQHVKIKTFQFYNDTAKHLREIGSLKLVQLTPKILETYYADKLLHGHLKKKGEPLSPTTIGHINRVLSIALEYAVKNEILMRNVAGMVKLPKKNPVKYAWYSIKELYVLDKIITGTYIEWPVRLAFRLGLRRGEAVGLKWKDINFDEMHCTIARSIVYNEGKIFESTPKTKYGLRIIPLTNNFCNQLKELKRKQKELLSMSGDEQTENTFVCITPDLNPYNPDYITRAFKAFLVRVGVTYGLRVIRFHDLRHSFASTSIFECDIAPEIVSKMLGHATSTFTLDVYGHASLDVKKRAAEQFDKKFNTCTLEEINDINMHNE